MVLARRVGSVRPYPLVLLLYVGTFGLYGIYWHYKAHHEVYRQFELDLEQRLEGVVWLLLDRAFFPLRWVFQHGFVGNVQHVRRRMGLKDGIDPAMFLSLVIPGSSLAYFALIMLLTGADGGPDSAAFLWASAGSFAFAAALQIPAYALLQRDMNDLWRAFDARMEEVMPRSGGWRPIAPTSDVSSVATTP